MITNVELLKRLETLLFEGAEYVPLAWRVDTHGVQIYEAPDHVGKWVQQSCRCPECGRTWEAVAPYQQSDHYLEVMSLGIEYWRGPSISEDQHCPKCGDDWVTAVSDEHGFLCFECDECGHRWRQSDELTEHAASAHATAV